MKNDIVLIVITSLLFISLFIGCSKDDFYDWEQYVYNDSTYVNDTIIKTDTIIGETDTIIKRDTIIITDTVVKTNHFNYEAEIYATIKGLGSCKGKSFQGFTVYNDIAFCFYNTGICRTLDLNTKQIIAEFNLPKEANHSKNHAGVACFSNDFISDEDEFPLLYLSSYQENKCYVLRVTKSNAEIVQSIFTYKEKKDTLSKREIETVWAYEPDGDKLLLKMAGPLDYRWTVMERPLISEEKVVYLDLDNKLDYYDVESSAMYNAGFAFNGKLYQLAGYTPASRKLYIIDYLKKKIIEDISWNNRIIYDSEQEQCAKFKDGILINYNGADKLVYVKFNNWTF